MIILEIIGWLLALGLTTILIFNIPMSLLTSLYTKIKYGQIVDQPKMPFWMIILGIGVTVIIGNAFVIWFNADTAAIYIAAGIRSFIYATFRY